METGTVLTKKQKKIFGPRSYAGKGYGDKAFIKAEVRFDDECGNGHNTFSITGDIYIPGSRDIEAGGCLHDEIGEVFPELKPFLKWHLCSTDGPMHYLVNALYHAGNEDYWGTRKGEPRSWEKSIQFGNNPIKHHFKQGFVKFLEQASTFQGDSRFDFEVLPLYHEDQGKPGKYQFQPKFTFGGYGERWHECPFDNEQEALNFLFALHNCEPSFVKVATVFGEGKERELDSARSVAIWPEATDEELTAPDLKEKLIARLPALMIEFRQAVESLGFVW